MPTSRQHLSPRPRGRSAALALVGAVLGAPLFSAQAPPRTAQAPPRTAQALPHTAPEPPQPRAAVTVGVTTPSLAPALEKRISLSVRDADLVEVVRSLVKIAGKNVVVDPSVRGTVTAELHDVPWDRALAVILKVNGLGMELDGNVIAVAPALAGKTPTHCRSAPCQ